MITVLAFRTTNLGFVPAERAGLVQYASLDAFTAAHNGTLLIGITAVTPRQCRTRLGARLYAWRMRRDGAQTQISETPPAPSSITLFRSAD